MSSSYDWNFPGGCQIVTGLYSNIISRWEMRFILYQFLIYCILILTQTHIFQLQKLNHHDTSISFFPQSGWSKEQDPSDETEIQQQQGEFVLTNVIEKRGLSEGNWVTACIDCINRPQPWPKLLGQSASPPLPQFTVEIYQALRVQWGDPTLCGGEGVGIIIWPSKKVGLMPPPPPPPVLYD